MTTPALTLTERQASGPLRLTAAQRKGLERHFKASIRSGDAPDTFVVSTGDVVGSVVLDGVTVVVKPKIAIDRVLFMASYANDPMRWKVDWASLAGSRDLVDGMAALFVRTCDRVLARGLYRSYRRVEAEEAVVRGRIRWQRQARRPAPLPIAVRYDVHDDDVLENQVVRAALAILRSTRIRDTAAAFGVARLWRTFRDLGVLQDARRALDRVTWQRQNEHYRPLIGLARLIIEGAMADVVEGSVLVPGFTLSMPDVFESFVRTALRERSGYTAREFPDHPAEHGLRLDQAGKVTLLPDLGVRRQNKWVFVGDVKYKRDDGIGRHGDLYQLLAYATAVGLDEATLIYADGPADVPFHVVRNTGVRLKLIHLDLARPPAQVLAQLDRVRLSPSAPMETLRRGVPV